MTDPTKPGPCLNCGHDATHDGQRDHYDPAEYCRARDCNCRDADRTIAALRAENERLRDVVGQLTISLLSRGVGSESQAEEAGP